MYLCKRVSRSLRHTATVAAWLLILTIIAATTQADDTHKEATNNNTLVAKQGPYCGLYGLYTIMKMAGQNIDFADLVRPEYISSDKGSSAAELIRAAQEHGLYASMISKLTTRELLASPYPLLLHVKSVEVSKDYDHFILFLGTRDGKARVLDLPQGQRFLDYPELARIWDGVGILVTTKPVDNATLFTPRRTRLALYGTTLLAAVASLRWVRGRCLRLSPPPSKTRILRHAAAQTAGLLLVATFAGALYHWIDKEGFLAHAHATASIQQAYMGSFIPKIQKDEVARLVGGNAVLIDARYPQDFNQGHLDNAINIPVNTADARRREALKQLNKDSRIVLYCQSAGCKFAETIAVKLVSDGFSNVALFKGGWQEWQTQTSKTGG